MGARHRTSGLNITPHSAGDPVTAAYQAVRLEILASAHEGRPEEQWMILNRLEIAYIQAGQPVEARTTHDRARALSGRHGHAAIERWERSPRWFKFLTRRFRDRIEARWTEDRYSLAAGFIDAQLSDVAHRHPRRWLVAA